MKQLTRRDLDLIEARAIAQARENFWAFRQLINPKMKKGWWQRKVAYHLQQFWEDMCAGLRPILLIEAPPQHGKSYQVIDFIAWMVGLNPNLRSLYASFSRRLGVRANLRLQRIFDSPVYRKVFPETYLVQVKAKNTGGYLRNADVLEFVGKEGGFRNTTVGGSITGEGLDVGVVDDPLKGREQANSLTIRDKTWEWFTDDFLTRFSDSAGLLFMLTRWHVDDPAARLLAQYPGVKVLSYPALAEPGVNLAPDDQRTLGSGDALFPEHKSREFLLIRRSLMSSGSWTSLYQQAPVVLGGDIIKGKDFHRYSVLPAILWRKIYADTAQKTGEHNDYSVFQCWGFGEDRKAYLIDQVRKKWEAPDLRRAAVDFWNKHQAVQGMGDLRAFMVEDKSSGTGLIQDLKRPPFALPILGIERNRDKLTRVMDVLPYIEAGHVCIPANAAFTSDFIEECEAFTADDNHAHDDQIDPMCDAISDMLAAKPVSFMDVDW